MKKICSRAKKVMMVVVKPENVKYVLKKDWLKLLFLLSVIQAILAYTLVGKNTQYNLRAVLVVVMCALSSSSCLSAGRKPQK